MEVHMLTKSSCWIDTEDGQYLQSYQTIICFRPKNGSSYIIQNGQPKSITTAKHLTQWIGESYKSALKTGKAIYGDIPNYKE
jgi:hypothetical protein